LIKESAAALKRKRAMIDTCNQQVAAIAAAKAAELAKEAARRRARLDFQNDPATAELRKQLAEATAEADTLVAQAAARNKKQKREENLQRTIFSAPPKASTPPSGRSSNQQGTPQRTAGHAAGKIQCPDFKLGSNFTNWLSSFERAARNAGLEPTSFSQPFELRLPANHRDGARYDWMTGELMDPSDWDSIRASAMSSFGGVTDDQLAAKTAAEFYNMRHWSPDQPIALFLASVLQKFYAWTTAAAYTQAEVDTHKGSTLLTRLGDVLPAVLRAEIPSARGTTWTDARIAIMAKYQKEIILGNPAILARSTTTFASVAATLKNRSSSPKGLPTPEQRPVRCQFNDGCRFRMKGCKKMHPSDTCARHPQATHTNGECKSMSFKPEPTKGPGPSAVETAVASIPVNRNKNN
jgi:hypothetical protein